MEDLHLTATKNTPEVFFSITAGTYRIMGNSIPENASELYAPVMAWLQKNLTHVADGATFEFDLPYFNSSSLKALYLVLLELKKEADQGKNLRLRWFAEENDEFMTEAAETFTEMVGIELELVIGKLQA
ncbi:MAG: DUF1987 domain-containing protein [Flavobacteriales bacterium]|nr:DUF1987 domain-containing protein [Flavobacteriales bacterium]